MITEIMDFPFRHHSPLKQISSAARLRRFLVTEYGLSAIVFDSTSEVYSPDHRVFFMYTDILINATPYENRIALVDSGNLLEFYIERPAEKDLVGNIYCGRVVRVLPGMQAAFVDIGLERAGFLYVDDVLISAGEVERRLAVHDQPFSQLLGSVGIRPSPAAAEYQAICLMKARMCWCRSARSRSAPREPA